MNKSVQLTLGYWAFWEPPFKEIKMNGKKQLRTIIFYFFKTQFKINILDFETLCLLFKF